MGIAPHVVTLLRVPIAIAFWFAWGHIAWEVALVVLAAATDAVDGNLARALVRRGIHVPAIGGWLDPLVDKLFVAIVVVAIGYHTHAYVALVLVAARELVLVPLLAIYLAVRREREELHAHWPGKLATIAQFVALAILVGAPDQRAVGLGAASVAAVLGLAAVAHYAIMGARSATARSARSTAERTSRRSR